jgi:hypothetical protein
VQISNINGSDSIRRDMLDYQIIAVNDFNAQGELYLALSNSNLFRNNVLLRNNYFELDARTRIFMAADMPGLVTATHIHMYPEVDAAISFAFATPHIINDIYCQDMVLFVATEDSGLLVFEIRNTTIIEVDDYLTPSILMEMP